jgi:ribosomal protein S18 acetylase RimI-like enzyme
MVDLGKKGGLEGLGKRMKMEIQYRQGRKEDCLQIAELISTASGGVVEFLFHDLIPGMSPVQMVARNLERDHPPHTYRNAIVAQSEDAIAGMALSFPSHFHEITEGMKKFFPPDRLEHVRPYYTAPVGRSLFLDAIAVKDEYRGKGIGRALISLTQEKARKSGYDALTLIAFAENRNARKLYERMGFETLEKIEIRPHELISYQGGCLLMRCPLL